MSESIHSGDLPLWNPYINYGLPQYGDMSSGYWSPVTWFFASTVGYNAYTLTIELLFYILIGGIGMYKLATAWQLDNRVTIIAGITFMCSGFMVGHLQHFNWISGAAFLPWCCWFYLLLVKQYTFKNLVATALSFYMLASSAHPGIIIGAGYFFIALMVFLFFKNDNKLAARLRLKKTVILNLVLLLLFLLLSAGMITGYLDILPHFVRGEKISLSDSLSNPTSLQSWISVLFPLATVKNDPFYNTDISMRNCYFSITLLVFFLLACIQKKNSWQKFLLITGLLFMLLSAGGIFKTIAYKFLPFIGYVRLNGEFRIFSLFCFIGIAAMELDKFVRNKNKFEGNVKRTLLVLEIILFSCIIFSLYRVTTVKEGIIYSYKNIIDQKGTALRLKTIIDAVSFYDAFWMQGIIQLFLIWGLKRALKFNNWYLMKKLLVADMIIACLFNIPYTGAGKASVARVQAALNKAPKGIPIPVLRQIKNIDTINSEEKKMIGDWSMYNKEVGVRREVSYPIALKNARQYFNNIDSFPDNSHLNKPFVFTNDSFNYTIKIEKFAADKIIVTARADSATQIILQQNYYPHWFYQNGNEKKEVTRTGISFMSAPLVKGNNTVIFSFEPTKVKCAMLLSAFVFIVCCTTLLIPSLKKVYS